MFVIAMSGSLAWLLQKLDMTVGLEEGESMWVCRSVCCESVKVVQFCGSITVVKPGMKKEQSLGELLFFPFIFSFILFLLNRLFICLSHSQSYKNELHVLA